MIQISKAEELKQLGMADYVIQYHPYNSSSKSYETLLAIKDLSLNENISDGIDSSAKGNYKLALECFNKALSANANNYDALIRAAFVLEHLKSFKEALNLYQKCLKIKIDDPYIYQRIGKVLNSLGWHKEAIDNYTCAVKINPLMFEVYYNLAETFTKIKNFDEALSNYDKVIQLKSDHVGAFYNRASLLLKHIKRYDDALLACNDLIELTQNLELKSDSTWHTVYSLKGDTLFFLERHEEAISFYEKGLDFFKADKTYLTLGVGLSALSQQYFRYAISLGEIERFDEGIFKINQAIEIRPISFHFQCRARYQYILNHHEEAIISYETAIALDPKVDVHHTYLGTLLIKLKRYEEAILHYEKALQFNPKSGSINKHYGLLLITLGRYRKAIPFFHESIKYTSDLDDLEDVYLDLIQSYDYLEWYKTALGCCEEALLTLKSKRIARWKVEFEERLSTEQLSLLKKQLSL